MEELKEGQEIIRYDNEKWIFDYYVQNNKIFCHKPNTTKFETGRIFNINVFERR